MQAARETNSEQCTAQQVSCLTDNVSTKGGFRILFLGIGISKWLLLFLLLLEKEKKGVRTLAVGAGADVNHTLYA